MVVGSPGLRSLFVVPLFGLLLGCLLLTSLVVPSRLKFREFGRSMMIVFSICLDRMPLCLISRLIVVMFLLLGLFGLVPLSLRSLMRLAFRFRGGPIPSRGLILGRGVALLRSVQLGGPRVRRARANVADAVDAADVFLYRDCSLAPLLSMRRRFKAVMDVLDSMIRCGGSLSRSVELTAQWDRILALGPMHPVTIDDLSLGRTLDLGAFFLAASDVHCRLSTFIHQVVVHRRDQAIQGWRNWIREDPLVHPYRWLRSDLVPPAPFLQCEPCLTSGGSGVLSDPARIDEEFRKAWLPYFCRSGQRETSLDEFSFEVDGWLPLLPEVQLPRLTGQMIADVVHRKSISAGGLGGWGWRELKVLLVSWLDALARILTKVEDLGVWPDGLL